MAEQIGKVKLDNARIAFAQALFEAQTVQGEGEPAYSSTFILTNAHPGLLLLEKAMLAVATDKWGAKAKEVIKQLRATDRLCVHNGDTKPEYDGFPGNFFVSARSKTRPTVIDRDKSQLTAADGRVYSGCYVNAIVVVWAMDNQFGKRINAQLAGVQFLKDGDAFGGGRAADADEFDELSVEEETATDLA